MKKYYVIVRTEELRGRMSSSRSVKCFGIAAAQACMEREYMTVARRHELTVDEDISDMERVVEFFPKMRMTFTIKEEA